MGGDDPGGFCHYISAWQGACSILASQAVYTERDSMRDSMFDKCDGVPSLLDVPTEAEAAAKESGAKVLEATRQLASLVWPGLQPEPSNSPSGYADWEMLQDELLAAGHVTHARTRDCCWGEGLWCFNPHCANLSGPSELQLKTLACKGGCGVRYCSEECEARGWVDGHRLSCGRLREQRSRRANRA